MFNESVFEAAENLESFGESWPPGEYSENWEALPRNRMRPPLPRPQQGNAVARQPEAGYATKAELAATANRLDGRIATNTKAISTLDGRVSSVGTAHARLESIVKREVTERKAATEATNKAIESMKMAVMLMPLLSAPKTQTVGGVDHVMVDDNDSFSKLLPMLLLSGGFGGSGGGGSSSDMMMPLMILAMAK